mgnify:CR=1 FL=1
MAKEITEQQAQTLLNAISDTCTDLALEPEQIIDGIARSLLAVATTFEYQDLKVSIENIGEVKIDLK